MTLHFFSFLVTELKHFFQDLKIWKNNSKDTKDYNDKHVQRRGQLRNKEKKYLQKNQAYN